MNPPSLALTSDWNGIANVLTSACTVAPAYNPATEARPANLPFTAIWDTGATNSAITRKVIADLHLIPISIADVHGVHGIRVANVYLVSIVLPNHVDFASLRVTEGEFIGGDVLIGMDIMNQGDVAITNYQGKTTFTFRMPSEKRIDFVPGANLKNLQLQQQKPHGGKHNRPKKHKQFGKNKRRR